MKEYELKYGCNPNQIPARIYMEGGGELPLTVLNGRPGYINFLDALGSWQLVSELKDALDMPAAASFKHTSPAGAAVGRPMSEKLMKACFADDAEGLNESAIACAYARARGTDRVSSFGDWIALSDECDAVTARLIRREVSDGITAPSYTDEALEILRSKKNGAYNIIRMDPDYVPAEMERRQLYGVTFEQKRNSCRTGRSLLSDIVTENKELPEDAARDLIIGLITLKYTQSNSVCFTYDGQTTGIGAGQQSRIHCTRLAAAKSDTWMLRMHDKVLGLPFRADLKRPQRDNAIDSYINRSEEDCCADGVWQKYFTKQPERLTEDEKKEWIASVSDVCCASDAFFPFSDNIMRAAASGTRYIAQPGGSLRDEDVINCCDRLGIVMAFTGLRLFCH